MGHCAGFYLLPVRGACWPGPARSWWPRHFGRPRSRANLSGAWRVIFLQVCAATRHPSGARFAGSHGANLQGASFRIWITPVQKSCKKRAVQLLRLEAPRPHENPALDDHGPDRRSRDEARAPHGCRVTWHARMASTTVSVNRFGMAFAPPVRRTARGIPGVRAAAQSAPSSQRPCDAPPMRKHGVAPVEESLGNRVKDLGECRVPDRARGPPARLLGAPATSPTIGRCPSAKQRRPRTASMALTFAASLDGSSPVPDRYGPATRIINGGVMWIATKSSRRLPRTCVRRQPGVRDSDSADGPAASGHAVRAFKASSGASLSIVKSWKSNPGPTVQPTSVYLPVVRAACQLPA